MPIKPDYNIDKRKIAIYARKSKITESGKSIENQISKCKSYAQIKFDISNIDNDIIIYKDEGISGFYSDRPQYMQMLKDIKDDKIKAVFCYKFDRISRKTIDLLNLVEQLKVKKIFFVSCSDDVDTSSKTGKIMMSLLASIAEFERDIIAERIADNMYELAKEGRWLGGTTPTGFFSKKEYTIINGRKTSVNYLEPIEDEQQTILSIYECFLNKRNINQVVIWTEKNNIKTKTGAKHTRVSIKNILTNPVYVIADSEMYQYFKAFDVLVYADKNDFDGEHGLMVYNKSEQTKELKDNSTAMQPEYVKRSIKRNISDWIISVGRHKGIISGRDWITVQSILKDNKDRFSLPNLKTESLLSGIIACPHCGVNLYTHRESNRYFENQPKYIFKCQTKKRKGGCKYKDVQGNQVDIFVINAVCSMNHKNNEYYNQLVSNELNLQIKSEKTINEISKLNKGIDKLNKEIANQTISLRLAADNTRKFIVDDIEKLACELKKIKLEKSKLEESKNKSDIDDNIIEKAKEIIFSFPKLVNYLSYQEKMELIRKVVHKVFVIHKNDGTDEVHIFLKGTPDFKYKDFLENVSDNKF